MFKKKNPSELEKNFKDSNQVVTEIVETKDGVIQTTRTVVSSSSTKEGIETAFKDFNIDPSRMGGTYVTKKVVYTTSSSGKRQITEERTETIETDDKKKKETKSHSCDNKHPKSFAEKLGFKSKTKEEPQVDVKSPAKQATTVKTGKFEDDCLKSHNEHRAKHGVSNLKLSKQLCSYSKEWADHLAATDSFEHRKERKYGENIYMKWSSDPSHAVSGHEAVESWYSEIKDYTFGKEPTTLKSGHFTQVVWKESSELGVAWARSKSGKILVVANYSPAGNFVGRFTANVPPPKK